MNEETEHQLIYPLVVCKTNGGPYEDDALWLVVISGI